MKKMMLAMMTFVTVTAFAQPGRPARDNRNDGAGQWNRKNKKEVYYFSERERDQQVRDLNRLYDDQISRLRSDRGLRGNERKMMISRIERERADKLRLVHERYNNSCNGYAYRH
jgi:hypothetical protein